MLHSVARSRSDTAPVAGQSQGQFAKDSGSSGMKGTSARLLARDDGFTFSESVSSNRVIAGIVSSSKPASAKPAFTGDSADR